MVNKEEILSFRNYLLSRFLYKNKILNIFLIIMYCGLIMLFISSLILVLNYKYNVKTNDEEKEKIFLILVIFSSVCLFLSTFIVVHAIIFLIVTNYVVIKTNNYRYLKETKKISYFSFVYTIYFYNKRQANNKTKKSLYNSLINCKQIGDFNGDN